MDKTESVESEETRYARSGGGHTDKHFTMPLTGSSNTRLIVIRGNSGSGKSSLAAAIREARPRGIAIVGQDQLRREILHVVEEPGTLSVEFIALSARFALDNGLHAIIEGILYSEIYGDALRALVSDHRGTSRCYRYDLPFEETLARHSTKANAYSFGELEMRQWWRDADPLKGVTEHILGRESSLHENVARILADCGWENHEESENRG